MNTGSRSRRFYTAGSRNYLPGLIALCRSFRAYHPADEIVVVRTPSSDLTERDLVLLIDSGATIEDLHRSEFISFIVSRLPEHRSKYGIETYVKIALVEKLAEPFYWIDCDIVVQSVIDPLCIGGGTAAAAASPTARCRASCFRDPKDRDLRDWISQTGEPESLLAAAPSFNCGLMWLNPEVLRENGFILLVQEILASFADQLITADESVFNLLSQRLDIRFLPQHSQRYVSADKPVNIRPAKPHWVVHFIGAEKPWTVGPSHPGWSDYQRWFDVESGT